MKRRKRGKGGRFVSSKKRRRSSRKRRRRTAVAVASNPRRRRRRASSRKRTSRRRRRSIFAMPRTNPTRRRRSSRRRRRNPSGGELTGGQLALATVVGATSFAVSTVLVPRLIPQQIHSSPGLYGTGMIVIGAVGMFLLRKFPVVALAAGVPITGAGAFLIGTGWLAKSGQQQQQTQQQPAANLGAVVLEDLARLQRGGSMGAVYPAQLGMGAVYPRDMGAVEALVGDAQWTRFRSPSVAAGMGAY